MKAWFISSCSGSNSSYSKTRGTPNSRIYIFGRRKSCVTTMVHHKFIQSEFISYQFPNGNGHFPKFPLALTATPPLSIRPQDIIPTAQAQLHPPRGQCTHFFAQNPRNTQLATQSNKPRNLRPQPWKCNSQLLATQTTTWGKRTPPHSEVDDSIPIQSQPRLEQYKSVRVVIRS